MESIFVSQLPDGVAGPDPVTAAVNIGSSETNPTVAAAAVPVTTPVNHGKSER
jgi:hypothetical protein